MEAVAQFALVSFPLHSVEDRGPWDSDAHIRGGFFLFS